MAVSEFFEPFWTKESGRDWEKFRASEIKVDFSTRRCFGLPGELFRPHCRELRRDIVKCTLTGFINGRMCIAWRVYRTIRTIVSLIRTMLYKSWHNGRIATQKSMPTTLSLYYNAKQREFMWRPSCHRREFPSKWRDAMSARSFIIFLYAFYMHLFICVCVFFKEICFHICLISKCTFQWIKFCM